MNPAHGMCTLATAYNYWSSVFLCISWYWLVYDMSHEGANYSMIPKNRSIYSTFPFKQRERDMTPCSLNIDPCLYLFLQKKGKG